MVKHAPSSNNTREDYTWTSPDGRHRNQTDYTLCSQRWRSCTESAKQDQELIVAKIMASVPIISWQIDRETMETVRDFILGAPKSLQMVTASMKLKDACSLEEKL